jgi:hypothetical protein
MSPAVGSHTRPVPDRYEEAADSWTPTSARGPMSPPGTAASVGRVKFSPPPTPEEPTMSEGLTVIAVIGIVAYVIGRQLLGEALRGKRVVLLPVILTVIGAADLGGGGRQVRPADVACLLVGGLLAAGIGLAQGGMLHLDARNGALWGQMPVRGLWLWLLLVASRALMTVVAYGLDAKVAAASTTVLLMLGINRLAQAAVVLPRAMTAGIPFAPEKDGKVFLARLTDGASPEGHERDR